MQGEPVWVIILEHRNWEAVNSKVQKYLCSCGWGSSEQLAVRTGARESLLPASVSHLSSAQLQLTLRVGIVVSSRHKSKSQLVQAVLNLFFIFPDFCVNRWLPTWFTLIFLSVELSVHFRKQIHKCLWLPQSSKILDAFYLSEMPYWFLSCLVTQLCYVL